MKPNFSILFGVLFTCSASHASNLVVGGDFESPLVPTGQSYILNVTPDGWSGMGDLAIQGYAGSVSSGNGNQWMDLNPGTGAGTGISQTIALQGGTSYRFSFLYNGGGGGSTTDIAFSLKDGQTNLFSDSVYTGLMNVYGGTPWGYYALDFTPTANASATLAFLPNGSWSGGFIDAVSISAVPIPGAIWLLGSSLACLGVLGKRRISKEPA